MNFRDFVNSLGSELTVIDKEVSPEYEAADIISALNERPVMFKKVAGSEMPVVAGLCSTRGIVAKGLGCTKEELLHRMSHALNNLTPPDVTENASCQEVVEEEVDLTKLPLLKYMAKDGGKYIPSAIAVINDPELGRNVCYHRLMLIDKDKFVARIVENRGTDTALKKAGGELDIAICIGNSTAVMLAASTTLKPNEDEFAMANTLDKTNLVKCRAIDVEVPAECEIVLEGRITKETHIEGPFLDLTGTYDKTREQPVIEIKRVTHRQDPIYQAILPGKLEHRTLMGMPKEPTIFDEVNKVCKCRNVLITPGGCSWLHAVVQIEKQNEDDGKKAIEAAFKGHNSLKHCVVVDGDIDIYDPNDIEWAISTRFQADKDAIVLSGQPGSSLDPSGDLSEGKKAKTAKAGLDATIPPSSTGKSFKRAEYGKINIKDYLEA